VGESETPTERRRQQKRNDEKDPEIGSDCTNAQQHRAHAPSPHIRWCEVNLTGSIIRSRQQEGVAINSTSSTGRLSTGLAGVTIAGLAGNALSYLLLLAAARVLAPSAFSEIVTLLNLLLVAYVGTLALQTVTARRVSVLSPSGTLTATIAVAVVGTAAVLALSPLASSFLHLPGLGGPFLVAAVLPGAVLQGWCQGVCQGRERFGALAIITLAGLIGRSGVALIGLYATHSAVGTLAWLAIGTAVAAAGSTYALRDTVRSSLHLEGLGDVLLECMHAAHAYGAFMVLTATDLLLARHLLSTDGSAVYAAGSVLTRIALWLPQSVASVLFASLTRPDTHRELYGRAVAGLAGLGALEVLGTTVLSGFVTSIVGGGKYPQLGNDIWLFAVLGALLSVVQFTLVAGLAARNVTIVATLWLTVAAECALVLGRHASSVRGVVGSVVIICTVTTVAAVGLRRWSSSYLTGAGQSGAS
jgi:O-antigen/teichoic acid export membrane protein